MPDQEQKARLKAMINHMIEKNDEAASTEFHAYLATKMQSALEKVGVPGSEETPPAAQE